MNSISPIESECLTRFQVNYSGYSKANTMISTDNTAFGIDNNTQCLNINNISNLKGLKSGMISLNISLLSSNAILYDSNNCNLYVTKNCDQEFYVLINDNIRIDPKSIERFIRLNLLAF